MDVDYGVVLGLLGILTGVVSLVYARLSAVGTHRQADSADQARREAAALAVISTFHTAEFAELILKVQRLPDLATPEEFEAMSPEDRLTRVTVTQRMEMLGVLVAEELVDLDLVEKTLGTFVLQAWEKMRFIAEHLRARTGDPAIAEYFQWLAERIAERAPARVPAYVALKGVDRAR